MRNKLAIASLIYAGALFLSSSCQGGDINGDARFLAGMGTGSGGATATSDAWKMYVQDQEKKWNNFRRLHLSLVEMFSKEINLYKEKVVFYMFGGPDAAYVNAFFPSASIYILSGLEEVGEFQDIEKLDQTHSDKLLRQLSINLNDYFRFGFFVTKDMTLEKGFPGALPLIAILLVRSGYYIEFATYIKISKEGQLLEVPSPKMASGVRISYHDGDMVKKTLYYFKTDLRDDNADKDSFLRFCYSFGNGDSLIKNASYLMHESSFSTVRNFILAHSSTITQDDSGIPIKYFSSNFWIIRLFGKYRGPAAQFSRFFQPEIENLQRGEEIKSVDFGIGYFWWLGGSHLQLVQRRSREP